MNYASLIKYIKDVAINNPLVKETIDGDIYQINNKENQYGVFCVTGNVATRNDHTTTYEFTLFYVDRLLEDQSNKNVVQTDAIICIQSVCNFINQNNENINISTPINYELFTQRFTDQCAGAFATINMEVEDSLGDCDLFYEGLLLDPTGATSGTSILDNYYTKAEVEELIRNATHDADMVDYDNSKTGLDATTAQDAIDKLYEITIDDPTFKAWLNTNATYLNVLLTEQPTNPENKYLNALRQWVEIAIGGAGYEAPLYYTNINSTIHIIGSDTLFYKKISYQPELGETPLTVQSKNNVRTLVGTYLYDAQISTTTIDSGNFGFKLKCKVNNTQGTNVIEYVPFLYHIDGTRTDLFTCISDPITNTIFLDNFKQFPSDTIHCVETDRLGVDVYFKSSSAALKTLDALIGDGHASYMVTPLRLRHDGLRDLDGNPNFLHINQEQKNKLINNYTYKILNTTVSTWSDSTTYSDYKYEAIVNINNLKESDSVEVIYNIIDAGSSNYAPGGELYEGYIKIFAKVNTTITIPTLVITKIDL